MRHQSLGGTNGDATVSVRLLDGRGTRFSIRKSILTSVTSEQSSGKHAVIEHCATYMQYSNTSGVDCSRRGYEIMDEYEAIPLHSGIESQVALVHDSGGRDTKGRPRIFWLDNLYHH